MQTYICPQKRYAHSPKGIYNTLKKQRKDRLSISQIDFIKWYVSQPQSCDYCGITSKEVNKRAEQYGLRTKYLTIDRKDSTKGYEQDNLSLACDNCNLTKSNVFSYSEMKKIGKHMRGIFEERLN